MHTLGSKGGADAPSARRARRSARRAVIVVAAVLAAAAVAAVTSASASPRVGTARIVNGERVPAFQYHAQWSYIVQLVIDEGGDNVFQCGGSLVTTQLVLTAAHCVTNDGGTVDPAADFTVMVGTEAADTNQGTAYGVSQVTRNPSYDPNTTTNDLALLHLSTPVTNPGITPIEVVGPGEDAIWGAGSGMTASNTSGPFAAGWGLLTDNGASPDYLMQVQLDVLSDGDCTSQLQGFDQSAMVCAGSGGHDTCNGDSGGPLIAYTGSAWREFGLTSWGVGCGTSPGAYTRLAAYRGWLATNGVPIGDTTVGAIGNATAGIVGGGLAADAAIHLTATFGAKPPHVAFAASMPAGYTRQGLTILRDSTGSAVTPSRLSALGSGYSAFGLPYGTYDAFLLVANSSDENVRSGVQIFTVPHSWVPSSRLAQVGHTRHIKITGSMYTTVPGSYRMRYTLSDAYDGAHQSFTLRVNTSAAVQGASRTATFTLPGSSFYPGDRVNVKIQYTGPRYSKTVTTHFNLH
jgi:secreted trypsin-like serine protease